LQVIVGCCGIPVSRAKYFEALKAVELQNTFYDLPTEDWARSFRSSIPEDAIVTVKAWQVITHPHTSPTWRRMKRKPSGDLSKYGFLRPTKENLEAWEKLRRIAQILGSKAIVFQTPPSFGYSEENLRNAIEFFKTVVRSEFLICWEPRGTWLQHTEAIRKVVSLGVVHVVDILKRDPIVPEDGTPALYTRLHGLGGEINYRYKYTDSDLQELADKVSRYSSVTPQFYVMFNNIYMFNDAVRFKNLAAEKGLAVV